VSLPETGREVGIGCVPDHPSIAISGFLLSTGVAFVLGSALGSPGGSTLLLQLVSALRGAVPTTFLVMVWT
jgi:hypothetical protein